MNDIVKNADIEKPAVPDDGAAGSPVEHSLFDDVDALIADGKTYVDAELNYQKSRAKFAGGQGKSIVAFGVVTILTLFFAGVALSLGLLIGLTPLITIWGATAVVTGIWLLIAATSGWRLKTAADRLARAFESDPE